MKLGIIVCVLSMGLGVCVCIALTRTEMPFKTVLSVYGHSADGDSALHAMSCDHIFIWALQAITELLQIQRELQCIRDSQPDRRTVDHAVPIAYLTLTGILESIDDSVEGRRSAWALPGDTFFRTVTLPLALPGIASALLITFVQSIEDFANRFVIGGKFNTLAVDAYLRSPVCFDTQGRNPGAVFYCLH